MDKNRVLLAPYVIEYLKLKLPNFQEKQKGKITYYTCPRCKKDSLTAILLPVSDICQYIIHCPSGCNRRVGDIIDVVRILEIDKKDWDDDAIIGYLNMFFNLDITTQADIIKTLDLYEKLGFSLVPLARNQKIPIERDWTNKEHKNKEEWKEWIDNKLNIGVRCGESSNITVIDIDAMPGKIKDRIYRGIATKEEITEAIRIKNETLPKILELFGNPEKEEGVLVGDTFGGLHLIYQYTDEIPTTRIDKFQTDILNDGKQCTIYPSVVSDYGRKWSSDLNKVVLKQIPEKLKKLLLSEITVGNLKTHSEKIREEIETENFKINPDDFKLKNNNLEGCCNDSFIKLGGILVKQLSTNDAGFVLRVLNKHLLEDPMSPQAISAMINSLDKFTNTDERELASKILEYIRIVEEASSNDIVDRLGERTPEGKQRIEKAISFLVKEGYIIKKRRIYHIVKKVEWKETWYEEGKLIDYIMPYFDDKAKFRNGDMIIVGGKQKVGKTHIALNIIKRLVNQGKKPYYISLESGSRFAIISGELGLKEGDYKYNKEIIKPETVELEDNAITILDWLLPTDYAETDKIFLHLSNQLKKHGGNLIVFVQLKTDGKFFAENMIAMFPALVAKYFYKNEEVGDDGYFDIEYMREAKTKRKKEQIHCKYDWDSRELLRLDEIPQVTNVVKGPDDKTISI